TVISGTADFNDQESWLFDGTSFVYNEKGTLISKFYYEKGTLQNDALYYFSNGQIKKIVPYVDDEITGELRQYTKDGEILLKTTYKNGIKHGSNIGFFSKENIAFIEEYENNLLLNGQYFKKSRIKMATIKNGDGEKAIFKNQKIKKLIEYKNGKPEGKVQIFTLDGYLQNEYFQKDDIKEGIETEYYKKNEIPKNYKSSNPIPKLEITWSSNNIHGTIKTWYKNLKLESQKEYVHNKKNGPHFAWYENGAVMFIEEYEDDIKDLEEDIRNKFEIYRSGNINGHVVYNFDKLDSESYKIERCLINNPGFIVNLFSQWLKAIQLIYDEIRFNGKFKFNLRIGSLDKFILNITDIHFHSITDIIDFERIIYTSNLEDVNKIKEILTDIFRELLRYFCEDLNHVEEIFPYFEHQISKCLKLVFPSQ
ncbi:hypothetical protein LCGC14_1503940, partial [marine sediment metagenome]